MQRTQFDTIYHEQFQYYTVLTAQRALAAGGLALVDVELLDPAQGIAPGQAVVIYDGTRVVGSATITATERDTTGVTGA